MATKAGPNIVKDGLVLHLDAASQRSNPGYGIRWRDLSPYGNDAIFNNSAGLVSTSSAIIQSSDDYEEDMNGTVMYTGVLGSSDIELGYIDETGSPTGNPDGHAAHQRIGLRFTGLQIPPKAAISASYIQFTVDETGTAGSPTLQIFGEKTGTSATFVEEANNLANRTKTTNFIMWENIPQWSSIGAAGADQRTPDLSSVIQEIVNLDTYTSQSAITIIIDSVGTATNVRTAEAFDGTAPPVLNVTYMNGPTFRSDFNGGILFTTASTQDARVTDNTTVQFGSSSFTVEVIAQANTETGRGRLVHRDDSATDLGWYLEARGTPTSDPPRISNDLEDGVIVDNGITGPVYSAGEVFHHVLQRDGDTLKIYHNGLAYNSASLTGLGDTDNPTAIYIGGAPGFYNDVQIYMVRMYNRALNDAEILQNYNATKTRFE